MKKYDTTVTEEELSAGNLDEYGIRYSHDGKRLLRVERYLRQQDYTVHPGTEVICDDAFYTDTGDDMNGIILPASLKAIGNAALKSSGIHHVTFAEGLLSIGNEAFADTNVTSIKLPESLLTIGDKAFAENKKLEAVTLPKSVVQIGQAPFRNCEKLQRIDVEEGNMNFSVCDGVLMDAKAFRIIKSCASPKPHFQIPETAMSCDCGAFSAWQLELIPQKIKARWKLQKIKEQWLALIDRPCGLRNEGNLVSIKFSNSLYCNIRKEDNKLICNDKMNFLILLNACGIAIRDILVTLGLADKVVLTEDNYDDYLDREVAEDVECTWDQEYFDEDTGEVVTFDRTDIVLKKFQTITAKEKEYLLYISQSCQITVYLYTDKIHSYYEYRYYFLPAERDLDQEEAIEELMQQAPLFISIAYLKDKNALLHAFSSVFRELLLEDAEEDKSYSVRKLTTGHEPFPDISPSDSINWIALIDEFFNRKIQRLRTGNISGSRFRKQMQTFLVSRQLPEYRIEQFISAFSFLLKKVEYPDDIWFL